MIIDLNYIIFVNVFIVLQFVINLYSYFYKKRTLLVKVQQNIMDAAFSQRVYTPYFSDSVSPKISLL